MGKSPNRQITTYAFIDSQNLNISVSKDVYDAKTGEKVYEGWPLDFKKFHFFMKNKFHIEQAFLFIGNKPGNERLYEYLQRCGYILILKPTTPYTDKNGKQQVKGNVDTDLVLHAAAKEVDNYDKAIVVAGDGDYLSLYEHLDAQGKLGTIIIPNKKSYSYLLNKYIDKHLYVNDHKPKLIKT